MASTLSALSYARLQLPRFIGELSDFIRFSSIGTDAAYHKAMVVCANWLANHLTTIGLKRVNVFPTQKHPIVYGEWIKQTDKPTLLIYGHYDVQPVAPLTQWAFPPFEPFVKGNYIYGRGASDDKGQMFAHVKAIDSFLQTYRQLPINVKCLFDGEEEMGSPSLEGFIESHKNLLKADIAVVSDMAMLSANQPSLTYALRGSLSVEIEIKGQGVDLHSGNFGGAIHNPLQVAAELIARLHHENGKIAIPGFYDAVKTYSQEERQYMLRFGASDEQIKQHAKAAHGWGEKGYTLYERTTIRPSLSVNGIVGGYQGPGVKSVIPSKATIKLNFRLVPHQDPSHIEALVRQYLKQIAPPTISLKIDANLHANSYEISVNHPAIQAGRYALMKGFGKTPVLNRVGGTIPVVSLLEKQLGISSILMGFGLPDDRIHAPNERFSLANFLKGIHTSLWFMAALGNKNLSSKIYSSTDKGNNVGIERRYQKFRENGHSKFKV